VGPYKIDPRTSLFQSSHYVVSSLVGDEVVPLL